MGDVDIASLIVALTGVLALVVGHVNNKRGQKQQAAQQVTANTLQGQAQQFEQQGAIIAELRTQRAEDRAEHAADIERLKAQHTEDVARLKAQHTEEGARCIEARTELVGTVALLSDVVRDEVARSLADMALADSVKHDERDHPNTEPVRRPGGT